VKAFTSAFYYKEEPNLTVAYMVTLQCTVNDTKRMSPCIYIWRVFNVAVSTRQHDISIYIYIYIYMCVCVCVYIYIYIYIYTDVSKEITRFLVVWKKRNILNNKNYCRGHRRHFH